MCENRSVRFLHLIIWKEGIQNFQWSVILYGITGKTSRIFDCTAGIRHGVAEIGLFQHLNVVGLGRQRRWFPGW